MRDDTAPAHRRAQIRDELTLLTTEAVNKNRPDLDTLDTLELVNEMNLEDTRVPAAVADQAGPIGRAIDGIVDRLNRGGRLIYVGAGTAGRMGVLDASECPPTFGTDPALIVGLIAGGEVALRSAVEHAEDDAEAPACELGALGLTDVDTLVGISASGRTPYVVGALNFGRSVGALTVAVTSNRPSVIGKLADIAIEVVVGPEFVSGSTRLKSGTAQKLVLNMLSTISMIKLGKTFNGVMVDLRATNEKLEARSERTVMTATGCSADLARFTIDAAGGSVKEAILMIMAGADHAVATQSLQRAGGILRIAIDSLQP